MSGRHESADNSTADEPTESMRIPPQADPANLVERKVTVATVVAGVLGGVLAVLNAIQANPGLIAGLPKSVQSVIFIAVPLVLVFTAGYMVPSNRV